MNEIERPESSSAFPLQGPHWAREPRQRSQPRLRLRLQHGDMVVELTRPELIIGRHSLADVRIPLPDVSRRHCRLLWQEGSWQVFDLSSLNGTYLNDHPIQYGVLHHGDMLRIGGFTFEVDLTHSDDTEVFQRKERPDEGAAGRDGSEGIVVRRAS